MAPLRIAILEADTPIPPVNDRYGGYGGLYESWLRAAQPTSRNHERELRFTAWDVVDAQAYPRLDDVDVVVITGSKHNAFDPDPWILRLVEYTRAILAQSRVRLVGVCFGHQIVGRAMDVPVSRGDVGWEAAVMDIELTAVGREVFGKERLALHQMHKDIVHAYPPSVVPLGSSPKCQVQGMYMPAKLISIQAHPEFNGEIVSQILEVRHKTGVFDDETFEDAMGRVGEAHDGVLVGARFLDFMVER